MILRVRQTGKNIQRPDAVARILKAVLSTDDKTDKDKEHFWAIGLDTRNKVRYIELVSLGTLNASLVHPREVFRTAVMKAAASIIVGHNHPSGDPQPSEEDLKITRRLSEAAKIMGIELLDHVVIGRNEHVSFKEKGLI